MDFTLGDVVDEGDVVGWVPVQGIADGVEVDAVQESVDWLDHLMTKTNK